MGPGRSRLTSWLHHCQWVSYLISLRTSVFPPVKMSPGYGENSAFHTLFSFPRTVFPMFHCCFFQLDCHFFQNASPATHGGFTVIFSLYYLPVTLCNYFFNYSLPFWIVNSHRIGMMSVSFIPVSPVPNSLMAHIWGGLYFFPE